MIDSRDINELHPIVRALCVEFIAKCELNGLKVTITATYRDKEYQDKLYAQGRTVKGDIITKAKGGSSYHNYRLAFDFAPLKGGKIDWNDIALFKKCGAIAESVGLEWGGSWKTFKDMPHCQYTGGLTLDDLRAGKTL